MTLRRRIWLAMAGVVLLGAALSLRFFIDDLRPRHLATMEEGLVDQAHILAHIAATKWDQPEELAVLFTPTTSLHAPAAIYEIAKSTYAAQITITDKRGQVLFGPEAGADHSQWNNIIRAMRGDYGARSTRTDPDDPHSSVLHVSAAIRIDNETVGVLTVSKHEANINSFLQRTRNSMMVALAYMGAGMVLLAALLTIWTTWPLRRLLQYVNNNDIDVADPLPHLGPSDVRALGEAFAAMQTRLQGKAYIERYVSALSHELKSPMAAIRGAVELLQEGLPADDQQRFITNIKRDSTRCESLLEQMVRLAAIERMGHLPDPQACDLQSIVQQQLQHHGQRHSIQTSLEHSLPCHGDAELLQLAVANILSNAEHFSLKNSVITVVGTTDATTVSLSVSDNGPGIPDWAIAKVRDRFFSLPRPDGHKSSGLGLSLVSEIAELHRGSLKIESTHGNGTKVCLCLPRFS